MAKTIAKATLAALTLSSAVSATPPQYGHHPSSPALTNAGTSLTFIYQNNLNASDDVNHQGAILLDPMSMRNGASACAAIGESLLPTATLQNHTSDFAYSLAYLAYAGLARHRQQYYIEDAVVQVSERAHKLHYSPIRYNAKRKKLPVLCTQSSTEKDGINALATEANKIAIASAGNTFVGFRNQKSFRFDGISYANPVERFKYSTPYSATGQTIQATSQGANCIQAYDSTSQEDCLFLNIQTPYIPRHGSKKNLKPVLFSIHGGGFTGGNGGAGSGRDAGNLASREDIVGVQLNYRLSTLGFLAVPGTDITGNYGIGDQITALQWVKENIAQFGGDPDRVTIIGESAGAGSVRALLGSPQVIGGNLIAGAVAQSSLGGGVTLGLDENYGTTYSSYLTVEDSYERAGEQIFTAVGCNQTSLNGQIDCLRTANASTIQSSATVARYVVQDGRIVNTPNLDLTNPSHNTTASVPVIFGTTADDGASFSTYPPNPVKNLSAGLQTALGISPHYANLIIESGLFPLHDTGNLTLSAFNLSQHIATATTFRCTSLATVYAASLTLSFPRAYYYTLARTLGGYDPNGLGASGLASGPVTQGYPNGNPNLPYFRLHGGDMGFTYGNLEILREERDLWAEMLIGGYFAQFARAGDPNPSLEYLKVRGYDKVSLLLVAFTTLPVSFWLM